MRLWEPRFCPTTNRKIEFRSRTLARNCWVLRAGHGIPTRDFNLGRVKFCHALSNFIDLAVILEAGQAGATGIGCSRAR